MKKEGKVGLVVGGLAIAAGIAYSVSRPGQEIGQIFLSDLNISPTDARVGGTVAIMVTATNVGATNASGKIRVLVNGVVAAQSVALDAGESRQLTFDFVPTAPGSYSVSVGDLTGGFVVSESQPSDGIVVEDLSVLPEKLIIGASLRICVRIINKGVQVETKTVTCYINGFPWSSYTIQLVPGQYASHVFRENGQLYYPEAEGLYSVEVDGLSATLEVFSQPLMPPAPEPQSGIAKWYGIVVDYMTGLPIEGVEIIQWIGGVGVIGYTDIRGWWHADCYNPGGGCCFIFAKDGYYRKAISGTYYNRDVRQYIVSMVPRPTGIATLSGTLLYGVAITEDHWPGQKEYIYYPAESFTVGLYASDVQEPIAITQTDSDGNYQFAVPAPPVSEFYWVDPVYYLRFSGMGVPRPHEHWCVMAGPFSIGVMENLNWTDFDLGTTRIVVCPGIV
jgi:hypothetical protein